MRNPSNLPLHLGGGGEERPISLTAHGQGGLSVIQGWWCVIRMSQLTCHRHLLFLLRFSRYSQCVFFHLLYALREISKCFGKLLISFVNLLFCWGGSLYSHFLILVTRYHLVLCYFCWDFSFFSWDFQTLKSFVLPVWEYL